MGIRKLGAALALIVMPVTAIAQMGEDGGGMSQSDVQRKIRQIEGGPLLGQDGKPIQILGSDGSPIVVFESEGKPRQQVRQFPNMFPDLGGEDGASPALLLAQLRKRLDQFAIPLGPSDASFELRLAADARSVGCRDDDTAYRCLVGAALRRSSERLAATARNAPNCDLAADDFRKFYKDRLPVSPDVARAFDIYCLGSFAPRLGDAGVDRPSLLADAETDGLLDIVGLLEVDGEVICAGLLRPNRKFITARHCIRGTGNIPMKVRLASNRLPAMKVHARRPLTGSQLGVAGDWAVLELEPGPILPIPTSRLTNLKFPEEVTIVGVYRNAQVDVYAPGVVAFERDLRFPRAGFCEAIEELSGCVQLACQTVQGFSGAPIISSRGVDGSVEVIGFLSSSDGNDTRCQKNVEVRNSTFAVSATAVQGL